MMIMGVFDIPIVADPSVPRGMARVNGRLHRLDGRNAAGWTAGAVAYGGQDAAECGLEREPDRDHVWLMDLPGAGGTVRVSARATSLRWASTAASDAAMETVSPGWVAARERMWREFVEQARREIARTRPPAMIIEGL